MGKSGEARLRIGQESLHSQLMSTSTRRIPAICISVPVRCNSLKLRGSWLLDNDQHKAHRPYSTLKQECCCPRETYRQKEREREGERAREREEATTIKQQYETKQQSKVEIVGKKIKEIGMKRRRRRIQREKWKKKNNNKRAGYDVGAPRRLPTLSRRRQRRHRIDPWNDPGNNSCCQDHSNFN